MATLARHQFFVTDTSGNVIPGAHVEVRAELPGQPLAALKDDRDGSTPKANPFDTDANGHAYFHVTGGAYQIRVYTGSSGSPTFEQIFRYVGIGVNSEGDSASSRVVRTVNAAGDVTISDEDEIVIIDKTVGEATTVNVDWSTRTKALTIVDGKSDALTNNISITPASGQSHRGTVDYVVVIDGNGGSETLTPLPDGSGGF